jgi:serine/threonine protein phosphatase PrpC
MVGNSTIVKILKAAKTPVQPVRNLAAETFRAGGRDNISLVVACRSDVSAERST